MTKRRNEKPTCALYHRVSTRDQNPMAARNELKRHAKRLGLRVVLYVDETVSGVRANRPGLERVMAAARKGELDCVICWKLDRFGRSLIDLHSRLRELQTLGVRFVASTQGIDIKADVNDPVARLHFNLLGAYAEFERELIVERTNLGLDVARRRGVRLGRPSKAVDMEKVRDMRGAKKSWDAIASELGVARSTVQAAVERDAKLLAKSSGVPNTAALRSFVERGQAAQRAVDELVGREAVPS